jgi:RNA polymerase sigma factor (sigma-70 family)
VTVSESDFLAEQFEAHRTHLRAVAYRMLGSVTEADDAVQESWLRLSRSNASEVENLGGWLTTVTARVCLDMLRSRKARREEQFGPHVPEPIVDPVDGTAPEHEALVADSVGLALLVVLETLDPAERLAFVLHDMFGVPFAEIAPIVDRSPEAARQLASRARRRVRGAPEPDPDIAAQREVVAAFLAAAREGDFDALLRVLDPGVVLRADTGALAVVASREVRGAEAVARQARGFTGMLDVRLALVNGAIGFVATRDGELFSVGGFTVRGGKILEINILADPERLSRLDPTILN